MADIRKAMSLITGEEPSPQQVQKVQALAHALDIPKNDPMLPILIALDSYHGAFSTLPEKNRIAANEAAEMSAKMAKQHIDRVMAQAVTEVTPTMNAAMKRVADQVSEAAGAKASARFVMIAIGVAAVGIVLSMSVGYLMGKKMTAADLTTTASWMTTPAGQQVYQAYQASPSFAEWTGTKDALLAFGMRNDIEALATCSRKGWSKEKMDGKTHCWPLAAKDGQYGWVLP